MNEQIREPIIDVERGTIQFHGGPEMLIVPKTLDISVENFFDLEMPEWLRQLLDENQALQMEDKIKSEYIRTLEADLYHANANLDNASDQLEAQAKEIERYADWEKSVKTALGYATELQSLRAENARFREVLDWYGDGSEDGGEKARNALIGGKTE
jgi:hypothetical protein